MSRIKMGTKSSRGDVFLKFHAGDYSRGPVYQESVTNRLGVEGFTNQGVKNYIGISGFTDQGDVARGITSRINRDDVYCETPGPRTNPRINWRCVEEFREGSIWR